MKIGIIGSGAVATALGEGFLKHGYEVTVGSRSPEKLSAWSAKNPDAKIGTFEDAGVFAEVVVLAVKGLAASNALKLAGVKNLAGKTVIDATNPIADLPPTNGVLSFFTDLNGSLMERLQDEVPEANFVKAFNSVGSPAMVNPQFAGGKPTMFVCGGDADAKLTVAGILDDFGWETADMGGPEAARAIEPLCILWCIPGFQNNDWFHAFKLLK